VVRLDLGRDRDQDLHLAQWNHSALQQHTCAFRALNVCTNFGVVYTSRNYANPLLRAVVASLPCYSFTLRCRFNERVRVLIKLRTALACHWPGVTPRHSPWKAACPVTIGVTGGYEDRRLRSLLPLGSHASNSPGASMAGLCRDRATGPTSVEAGVRLGPCPSMRRAVTVRCSRASTV
jgi:hypothetical protein